MIEVHAYGNRSNLALVSHNVDVSRGPALATHPDVAIATGIHRARPDVTAVLGHDPARRVLVDALAAIPDHEHAFG